jgi:GntR family transcriptional regulator
MATVPAHKRIRDDLVAEIESGVLSARDRLPGEVDLAARYGVTRMTVRQALTNLVNDGLLVRRRGVGTFVAENAAQRRNMSRLTGFTEDMRSSGRSVETRMVAQRIIPASADVAEALQLAAPGLHVTHVGRLRVVDGTPVIIQHSWVPYDLCPDLWSEPLVDDSLYATLRNKYDIVLRRADQRIAAVSAGREHAALLEVPARAPLLRVERVTLDDRNVPVELARSWMRPGFEIATHIER